MTGRHGSRAVLRALAGVLALTGVLASSDAARAADAGLADGALVYTAGPGEVNELTIVAGDGEYVVRDTGVPSVVVGRGCSATGDPQVVACPASRVAQVSVGLGDGDDAVRIVAPAPAVVTGDEGQDEGEDLIIGGAGSDTLLGGNGADRVFGGGGDDELRENDAAPNVLDGGAGRDVLFGGLGSDELHGGAGDDPLLFGGSGSDAVDGGEGDDTLHSGFGNDELGGGDADRLAGGPGTDRVTYEQRAVPIRASLGDGPNDGAFGEGDDVVADVERLHGGQGPDALTGGPGDDELDGRGGADRVDGGPGDDRLDGGTDDAAADTLGGGPGADTLEGRGGGDRLDGGAEADLLRAGPGADVLFGEDGADTLLGEEGDDNLEGGAQADAMVGGDGQDVVRYPARTSPVEVTIDGQPNDGEVTAVGDGRDRLAEGARSEADNVDASNEIVDGGGQSDTVSGDADPNRLMGQTGEDVLDGRGGADQLSGGGRNDTITSRDGRPDRVTCGAGYDYVLADRRDIIGRDALCDYVDDGSRREPSVRRDFVMAPRCAAGADAEFAVPGTRRPVPAGDRRLVPDGSRIDSFDCDVRLEMPVGGGETRGGTVEGGTRYRTGEMRVSQRRRDDGEVVTDIEATDCRTAARAARSVAVAARFPRARYRRRYGRIAFPARVTLDSAVLSKGRGVATFEVDDRCRGGATVRVVSGRLTVVDLGTDRRVVLGPGDRHTVGSP